MGLWQLVRVHAGGGPGQFTPARISGPDIVLGNQLSQGLRVEGWRYEAVQPAPGIDGGRIHNI